MRFKKGFLMRFTAVFCAMMIIFNAVPFSPQNTVNAFPGAAMVTKVTKTVLERQAIKLLGKIADKTDSKILTMAYNYLIDPKGQKLNALMETSQEILATVKTIEADLQDLSHDVNAGLGDIKELILQEQVQNQYQEIDQIYSKNKMLWEKYCDLLDLLNNTDDVPTTEQKAKIENMIAQIRMLYNIESLRNDISVLMGLLSDQPLTDELSPVITHNPNDPTYVKAVREKLRTTYPFEHQVVLGVRQATNDIVVPLIQLMTLYGDFVQFEYELVAGDPNSTSTQLVNAQASVDLYQSYYNMMVNTIDNVCDQADVLSLMQPEDVEIDIYVENTSGAQPSKAYRVVLNDTGYEVIIAAAARNLKDGVFENANNSVYEASYLIDAMEITSPTHRKFVTPHNREEYKKIFSTIYKEQANQNPRKYFSELGRLGKYADEEGNTVDAFEYADYFLINNVEFDKATLGVGWSNYNFSILDASSFDASTNEDSTIDTDSQDVYNGDYNGTYLLIWVDEEGVTEDNADQNVRVWSLDSSSPCTVSFAPEGSDDWTTEYAKLPVGTDLNIKVDLDKGYRLKSLYLKGLINSAGLTNDMRQDIVIDGDYMSHEDTVYHSIYLGKQDIQLFAEIDNVYSITTGASGGATLTCELTEQIAGEQVDFKVDIPYGSDADIILYGLVTGDTYPVMKGTFEMPAEPCSITADATVAVPDGEGTESDPIVIKTRGELEYLSMEENSELWSKNIKLGASIDLLDRDWQPIGTEATPFTGTFDGNGYIIENLTVTDKDGGMFGVNNGKIINLQLLDVSISSDTAVGITAKTNNGTIVNCIVAKGLTYGNVAGIAGTNNGTMAKCCTVDVYGLASGNGLTISEQKLKYCYTDIMGEKNGTYMSREKMIESGFVSMINHIEDVENYGFYWTVDTTRTDSYPTLTSDPDIEKLYGFWNTDGAYGNIVCTPAIAKPGETVNFEVFERTVLKGDQFDTNITSLKALDDQGNQIEFITDTSFVMPESDVTFVVEYTSVMHRFDGLGTKESPWIIKTARDFCCLSTLFTCEYETYGTGYYLVTADIDMSPLTNCKPIGSESMPFAGTFNGNGHVIENLTVTNKEGGLFGVNNGMILNLQLINVSITADTPVGIIAKTNNGTIANSVVAMGEVHGDVGGIAGTNNGFLTRCCTIGIEGFENGKGLLAVPSYMLFLCFTDAAGEQNGDYMTREKMSETGLASMLNHMSNADEFGCYWFIDTSKEMAFPRLTVNKMYSDLYGFFGTTGEYGKLICDPPFASKGDTVNIEIVDASADISDAYVMSIKAIDDNGNEIAFLSKTSFVMPDSNVTFIVEYVSVDSHFEGSGTKNDPWIIKNETDLTNLSLLCEHEYETYGSAYYRMTADIDMQSVKEYTPIGSEEFPFNGNFDGNGYVISSLKIAGDTYAGVFGHTGESAHIHHLGVENALFTTLSESSSFIGGIAAVTTGGTIDSCYFDGNIVSAVTVQTGISLVGGIVGQMYETVIKNCYNVGSVSGPAAGHLFMQLGGIAGGSNGFVFSEDRIINCYNAGNIITTMEFGKKESDGAIMGSAVDGGIKNCYFDKETSVTSYAYLDMFSGEIVKTGALSTADMKVLADKLGDAFTNAPGNVNNGYPVLAGVGVGKTYEISMSFPEEVTLRVGTRESTEKTFKVFRGQDFTFEIMPKELRSKIMVLVDGVPLKQMPETYTVENIVKNTHIELVIERETVTNPSTGEFGIAIFISCLLASAFVTTAVIRKKRFN